MNNDINLKAEQGYELIDDPEIINMCKQYNEILKDINKGKIIRKFLEKHFLGMRIEVKGVGRIDFSTKQKMEYIPIEEEENNE